MRLYATRVSCVYILKRREEARLPADDQRGAPDMGSGAIGNHSAGHDVWNTHREVVRAVYGRRCELLQRCVFVVEALRCIGRCVCPKYLHDDALGRVPGKRAFVHLARLPPPNAAPKRPRAPIDNNGWHPFASRTTGGLPLRERLRKTRARNGVGIDEKRCTTKATRRRSRKPCHLGRRTA